MPEDTPEQRRKKELYLRIVADRKPYFQRYIYSDVMRDYKNYIKSTDGNSIARFGVLPGELMEQEVLTDAQADFIKWYWIKMPLGTHECVMNRICRRVEEETSAQRRAVRVEPYNYNRLSTGEIGTVSMRNAVIDGGKEYGAELTRLAKCYQSGSNDYDLHVRDAKQRFIEESMLLKCPNIDVACDIAIKQCCKKRANIGFLWDLFGDVIIARLLELKGHIIHVPVADDNGTIEFCGNRYSVVEVTLDGEIDQFDTEREGLC